MKRLFSFAFVFILALSAKADWLYWQIGGDDSESDPLASVMEYANKIGVNWESANFYRVSVANPSDRTQIAALANTEYSS